MMMMMLVMMVMKFLSVVIIRPRTCMCVQVFSLITFICATVWHDFVPLGGGWVQFVAMMAFILTTFLYMLYAFRLASKLSEHIPFKFTVSAIDAYFAVQGRLSLRGICHTVKYHYMQIKLFLATVLPPPRIFNT